MSILYELRQCVKISTMLLARLSINIDPLRNTKILPWHQLRPSLLAMALAPFGGISNHYRKLSKNTNGWYIFFLWTAEHEFKKKKVNLSTANVTAFVSSSDKIFLQVSEACSSLGYRSGLFRSADPGANYCFHFSPFVGIRFVAEVTNPWMGLCSRILFPFVFFGGGGFALWSDAFLFECVRSVKWFWV